MSLTIGSLAATADCSVDAVRYYERAGLLPSPPRTAGGHRQYADVDRTRLLVIRRSRQLGFSLDEIRELLRLAERDATDCAAIQSLAAVHLEGLERRIRELQTWRSALRRLIAACEQEGGPACPILDALAEEPSPRKTARRPAGRSRRAP